MLYSNVVSGTFVSRPNRFIANVKIDGAVHTVHVKNTGRCRELLVPGACVFLEKADNPNRKTQYDLIGVMKSDMFVNIDSQAPNKAVGEFLKSGKLFDDISYIKPEYTVGKSRFDFYFERQGKGCFLEVKGVTLEEDGVARFPDAPTERGVKHINELIELKRSGYNSYIFFLVQFGKVKYFTPNDSTHKAFGDALRRAKCAGVEILCFSSLVTKDEIKVLSPVDIVL